MNFIKGGNKNFRDFEEAEFDMRKSMPPVLYKYRDWSDKKHHNVLLEPSIWFSHPYALNDPYDIRLPEIINYGDINSKQFTEKLKISVAHQHPELKYGSRDFEIACANIHGIIKENPEAWFKRNQQEIRESNIYDCVGVFSLSKNPLSESLWAYYGNNGKGFCVGYDPVEIMKKNPCSFSIVEYNDDPVERNLLESNEEFDSFWHFFRKQKKWSYEEEYRFVTLFIDKNSDRKIHLPLVAIKEVILGFQIESEQKKEIINVLKLKFESRLPLYELKVKTSDYGFDKVSVHY